MVGFTVLATVLHVSRYPVFVDVYYHMAAVQGFKTAGGVVTHAFWEAAPAGRVHIYPPGLHAAGYLLSFLGISPVLYVTLLSAASWPACMLATWLWLRRILGRRTALFAVLFLCGPPTFWWNQTAHTANAAVLVVAPLALLALESEHFLLCGVLNFITISLHPIGLFLPPALVAGALVRRRNVVDTLLAAAVPVLLFSPWLAHMWANREVVVRGPGMHGVNLGLFMLAFSLPALAALYRHWRAASGLVGAAIGCAVVLAAPMGLSGRFFLFNVHWLLAPFAAFGLDFVLKNLEVRQRWKTAARVAELCIGAAALVVFPSFDSMPGPRPGPGGRRAGPDGPPPGPGGPPPLAGGPGRVRPAFGPRGRSLDLEGKGRLPLRVSVHSAALPQLFQEGPGPGPGGGGLGGMNFINHPGADAFLAAIKRTVSSGEVIFAAEPPFAALIAGVTGRWTTGAMLHEVRSTAPPPLPQECDYFVTKQGREGPPPLMPGPRFQRPFAFGPPQGFRKLFENEFGSLWVNPNRTVCQRSAAPPVLGFTHLACLVAVGLAVAAVDLLRVLRARALRVFGLLSTLAAAVCLWPLARAALQELLEKGF